MAKFGVLPGSIPDYLALVGDAADGFPGLSGWGATSAVAVLAKFKHLEAIPKEFQDWQVRVSSAARLSDTLEARLEQAFLFRTLATLRRDVPVLPREGTPLGRTDKGIPVLVGPPVCEREKLRKEDPLVFGAITT